MTASGNPSPPSWLTDVVARLPHTEPSYFSRFLPPASGGKASAVLMLFGPLEQDVGVVLTRRAFSLRSHPGQVSFVGGRVDATDPSPAAAALREGQEEVGLQPDSVTVLGCIPDLYIPVSRSVVTPVIAWWERPHPLHVRSLHEVHDVRQLSVSELLDPRRRCTVVHPSGHRGPGFVVDDWVLWGFTAGLLHRLFQLAGLARPWDHERVIDLPAGFGGSARSPSTAPSGGTTPCSNRD